jgi:hypothetical protein
VHSKIGPIGAFSIRSHRGDEPEIVNVSVSAWAQRINQRLTYRIVSGSLCTDWRRRRNRPGTRVQLVGRSRFAEADAMEVAYRREQGQASRSASDLGFPELRANSVPPLPRVGARKRKKPASSMRRIELRAELHLSLGRWCAQRDEALSLADLLPAGGARLRQDAGRSTSTTRILPLPRKRRTNSHPGRLTCRFWLPLR